MIRGKRGFDRGIFRYSTLSKKASMRDELLYIIFQVMMVVFVGLLIFTYVNNKTSDVGFEKRFIANDLGLIATSLYASPGNMLYQYSQPLDVSELEDVDGNPVKLRFALGGLGNMDTRVFVIQTDRPQYNPPWFYYARDLSTPPYMLPFMDYGLDLTLFRFGYDLDDTLKRTNFNKISCPVYVWSDQEEVGAWTDKKKVFFDVESDVPKEKEIASQIKTTLKNKNRFAITDKPEEADVSIGLRIRREVEVGAIRTYINEDDVNTKKARTLACSLINELLTPETFVNYVQTIPVSSTSDKINESWLKLLNENTNNTKVVLEFGILDETQIDFENSANAIFNALSRFYNTKQQIKLPTSGATISAAITASAYSSQTSSSTQTLPTDQTICTGQTEKLIDFPFHDDVWLKDNETNGARVWIPAQANCEGSYPLMIFLHGQRKKVPRYQHSLLYREGSEKGAVDLSQDAKKLIDAGKSRPFMLAAPTHDNEGSSSSKTLWKGFDTAEFVRAVKAVLPEGIKVGPVILLGHSAAGCDGQGAAGIFSGARSSIDHYLIGQIDTCMNGGYGTYLKQYVDKDTIFLSMYLPVKWGAGRKPSDSSFTSGWDEQNAKMGMTTEESCESFTYNSATLGDCVSDGNKWHSMSVKGLKDVGDTGAHSLMRNVALEYVALTYLQPLQSQVNVTGGNNT